MAVSRIGIAVGALACAGCYLGVPHGQDGPGSTSDAAAPTETMGPADQPETHTGATEPGDDDSSSSGSEPSAGGLPCEVEQLLADRCRNCHGDPGAAGVPSPLISLADLLATSVTDPPRSVGEVARDRVGDGPDLRMPPLPATPLTADEVAALTAWIDAGMPAGDCDDDPEPDPFDVDPTCTSDSFWTGGLDGDSRMNPGEACIRCHADPSQFGAEPGEDAPEFSIAGTVFPTAHEPDDCFGLSGDVAVEVTSADGQAVMLSPNEGGNFFAEDADLPAGFAPPFKAKVIAGGLERAMVGAVEHGDCNLCHSQDGNEDAPGRIIPP